MLYVFFYESILDDYNFVYDSYKETGLLLKFKSLKLDKDILNFIKNE